MSVLKLPICCCMSSTLTMTEASRGFSGAGEPVWDFSRGMSGSSGSLSCGAREVRCPCAWRGGARRGTFGGRRKAVRDRLALHNSSHQVAKVLELQLQQHPFR